ncbi:MAG TPA: STAS/SEC14 domain-containing protein [Ignavibacteria bacterium]|nr:STAS/SEC14 domain-containing protein [Ignavibacteria bacterium]
MLTDKKNAIETPGGNRLWYEDNIIHYFMPSPVDEKEAFILRDGGKDFIEKENASLVLIDLQQSTQFSSEARKIWVKFLQNPKIKRTAIFGGNVFVRTLASFVIAASQKKNIKFFIKEKEALEWLRE